MGMNRVNNFRLLFFPINACNRTCLYGFFYQIFRLTLRLDDLCGRVLAMERGFILKLHKENSRGRYNPKGDTGEKQKLCSANLQKAMELELELRRFVSSLR